MANTESVWLQKPQAFDLYKLFRDEWYELLKLHHENLHKYLTFTVTLLGATVAGILSVRGQGYIGVFILVGPVVNILVSALAIRTCDRFYLGCLERIAIIAKLESLLGLRDYVYSSGSNQSDKLALAQDKHLLPDRWIKGTECDSTNEFIQRHSDAGVNLFARRAFQLLIGVNIFIGIAILFVIFL